MFTPSNFRDLFLPCFENIKENLTHFPSKVSESINFSDDLNSLIVDSGFDPKDFHTSILCLNELRQNVNIDKTASLSDKFRYFIELENLTMRFSIKSLKYKKFKW